MIGMTCRGDRTCHGSLHPPGVMLKAFGPEASVLKHDPMRWGRQTFGVRISFLVSASLPACSCLHQNRSLAAVLARDDNGVGRVAPLIGSEMRCAREIASQ